MTKKQIQFLLDVIAHASFGGGLVDIAYETKQMLLKMLEEASE